MHKTAEHESYGPGHRIFDCPWCGAISGIDPDHIGDEFRCPECNKDTKLTDQNTRRGHLTDEELEPQESYGPGHRTFDCPWCGAIVGIDPSHVGEDFTCPECHKHTKLTEKNVRDSPMVDAPDAPHHEESRSSWPLAVVALLVVIGVVWVVASGEGSGSGDADRDGGRDVAKVPGTGTGPATPETGPGDVPGEAPPPEEGGDAPETPPSETPPTESPPAQPSVEEVRAALASAETALSEAQHRLDTWREENPALAEVLAQRYAREKLVSALDERVAMIASGKPADARALNAAMRDIVGESPDLVPIAERIMSQLARDVVRPARLATWRDLNFAQPRVGRALQLIVEEARRLVPPEYGKLTEAVAEAGRAYDRAKADLERAKSAESGNG